MIMSLFNSGHVKWSWCQIKGTPQIPMINNSRSSSKHRSSSHQWNPYESALTSVTSDHDYAAVLSPSFSDEASTYKQCIIRSKMAREQRNPRYRREHKPYLKRSMVQINLTTEQIISLEEVFQRKPHVTLEERINLAEKLQIDTNTIKNWFRNRRQSTNRVEQHYCVPDSPKSDESSNSYLDRLALIEIRIKENTDLNGYVLLDDGLMNNLVSVIDECLSKRNDNQRSEKPSTEQRYYEPVSPAATSDDTEDMIPWKNLDPEENLQRLLDIQAVLYSHSRYI